MKKTPLPTQRRSEIADSLRTCKSAFVAILIFSLFANLLMLTGPLYMLQIYDRVLSSGSIPTLFALSVLVVFLYALFGFLEFVRGRVLLRVGRVLDESLRDRAFDAVAFHSMRHDPNVRSLPIQDLVTVRQFLSSPGPLAFLDLPWTPIYLAVIFLVHPILGLAATGATILLAIIAMFNDAITRKHLLEAQNSVQTASKSSDELRRNVEVASVLGMMGTLRKRWNEMQSKAMDSQTRASDRGGLATSISKAMRLAFQSAILGTGAYLAVKQEISPGAMIAASIIMSRALAPVEQVVAQWQSFAAFRRSRKRLEAVLNETPIQRQLLDLPEPEGRLTANNLTAYVRGVEKPIIAGVSFEVPPGSGLGIIGPTGAGKSTLARCIVGVWPLIRGEMRLDGAMLDQWDPERLGRYVGYLPQDVELFDGSIGENIARFDPEADPEAIVRAAQHANVHELVLAMDDGYNTMIGESGANLSAGQRQRLGLARALYRDPVLVVLDEPNSNLDAEGEAALVRSITGVRERGGTVVVVAHRPSAIAALDMLLMLRDGRQVAFGPRDEVLQKVMARPTNTSGTPGSLAVVGDKR